MPAQMMPFGLQGHMSDQCEDIRTQINRKIHANYRISRDSQVLGSAGLIISI